MPVICSLGPPTNASSHVWVSSFLGYWAGDCWFLFFLFGFLVWGFQQYFYWFVWAQSTMGLSFWCFVCVKVLWHHHFLWKLLCFIVSFLLLFVVCVYCVVYYIFYIEKYYIISILHTPTKFQQNTNKNQQTTHHQTNSKRNKGVGRKHKQTKLYIPPFLLELYGGNELKHLL